MMEKYKPKVLMERCIEVGKCEWPQAVYRINGKEYIEFCFGSAGFNNTRAAGHFPEECHIWNKAEKDARHFNEILRLSKYNDPYWTNKKERDYCFELIFNTIDQYTGVSIPLFKFEIWLMNNDWKIQSWCPLSARHPGMSFFSATTTMGYGRFYAKGEKEVYMAFGMSQTHTHYFHFGYYGANIPMDEEMFRDAIDHKLKHWA